MPLGRLCFADKFLPFSATIERRGDLAKIKERCRSPVGVVGGGWVRLRGIHDLDISVVPLG